MKNSKRAVYNKSFNMKSVSCFNYESLAFDLSAVTNSTLRDGSIASGTSFRSQILSSSLVMLHVNGFSALEPFFNTVDVQHCRANRLEWQTGSFFNVNLYYSSFEESQFIDCKFSSVKFQDCTLTGDYFRECRFGNVSFENTTLDGVHFQACDLRGVDWSKAHLVNCIFENCLVNFEGMKKAADMQGLNLNHKYWNGKHTVCFMPIPTEAYPLNLCA